MFHAIRHWWIEGRGRLTARVFLFEFVVVVLGVLVAQWVADWTKQRADLALLEQSKSRLEDQGSSAMANAEAWLVAIPCLDRQVSDIMRAAGSDRPLDPGILERPGFRIPIVGPIPAESELLLIDRYGSQRAQLYGSIKVRVDHIATLSNRVAEQWMGLSILDTSFGIVRDGDRVNARALASQIRSQLRSIQIASAGLLDEGGQLGLKSKDIDGRRRPRNCADIRESGTIMPYVAAKGA
jgi:hypothetical protein